MLHRLYIAIGISGAVQHLDLQIIFHLRHETGHYYWDRLVAGTPFQEKFREAFGDERQDYAAALQAHYQQGAPTDWQEHFVLGSLSAHHRYAGDGERLRNHRATAPDA